MRSSVLKILRLITKLGGLWVFILVAHACTTVKPYERQYLNDVEMQINTGNTSFESYAIEIRQGAIAPTYNKDSGGCGCN